MQIIKRQTNTFLVVASECPPLLLPLPRARQYYKGILVGLPFSSSKTQKGIKQLAIQPFTMGSLQLSSQTITSVTFQGTPRRAEATPTLNTHTDQAKARVSVQAATRQTKYSDDKLSVSSWEGSHTHIGFETVAHTLSVKQLSSGFICNPLISL